jgi:hypothetical protein
MGRNVPHQTDTVCARARARDSGVVPLLHSATARTVSSAVRVDSTGNCRCRGLA